MFSSGPEHLKMQKITIICLFFLMLVVASQTGCERITKGKNTHSNNLAEQIGREIFFDASLSSPGGISCGSCHKPGLAFSDSSITSKGSLGHHNHRNSPSIMYSRFVPALAFDAKEGVFSGGFFMDGRANSLAAQAEGPLFDHKEMNLGSKEELLLKIQSAPYAKSFMQKFGEDIFADADKAYEAVLACITAFEQGSELNPFNSKFDKYLAGKATLSAEEALGLKLFNDPAKGNCAACHPSTPDAASGKVLFTDFTYDNLGIPRNPSNPFYAEPAEFNPMGASFADAGLGATRRNPEFNGQFRVPTLRNIALTAPYGHNGYFKTLESVMEFYNSRDKGHFEAEFKGNVNAEELGNLGLNQAEMKAIIAFLKTLTDE